MLSFSKEYIRLEKIADSKPFKFEHFSFPEKLTNPILQILSLELLNTKKKYANNK